MVVRINKSGKGTSFPKHGGRPVGAVPFKERYCKRIRLTEEAYSFLKVFVRNSNQKTLTGALEYILTVVRETKEVREALGLEGGAE
jgi:hypothetical protein